MPYYDRGEILDGALDGQHLEICWIKDPTDALLIQLQGSARVRLEDGTILRINYDAITDIRSLPVGRILIERNIIPREEISLERIREWIARQSAERRGSATPKPILCVFPDRRVSPMTGSPSARRAFANARTVDCCRQLAACVRHAVFYPDQSAATDEKRTGA